GLLALGVERALVAVEILLERRDHLALLALELARLVQRRLVTREVDLERADRLLEPLALVAPVVARAIEAPDLVRDLAKPREHAGGRDRRVESFAAARQLRAVPRADDGVAIHGLRMIRRVEVLVVETEHARGERTQARLVVHVQRHAHQREPALEVAVPD